MIGSDAPPAGPSARAGPRRRALVRMGRMKATTAITIVAAFTLAPLAACERAAPPRPALGTATPLQAARQGFTTRLLEQLRDDEAPEPPPAGLLDLVKFPAPLGENWAYLTPSSGRPRGPAIIWITGGNCNTIGDCWSEAPPENDQSGRQFREAGIVMMYPSLRGACGNPGFEEGFFGEVDDVLAAADFLARQPHVDPDRIYLGGHSTGATLAMLVAECTPRFRAVFCLGPAEDPRGYPEGLFAYDSANDREMNLRAPGQWTAGITSPTFVIEGEHGNAGSLLEFIRVRSDAMHCILLPGQDHFSIIRPTLTFIAEKIKNDSGPRGSISITHVELNAHVKAQSPAPGGPR